MSNPIRTLPRATLTLPLTHTLSSLSPSRTPNSERAPHATGSGLVKVGSTLHQRKGSLPCGNLLSASIILEPGFLFKQLFFSLPLTHRTHSPFSTLAVRRLLTRDHTRHEHRPPTRPRPKFTQNSPSCARRPSSGRPWGVSTTLTATLTFFAHVRQSETIRSKSAPTPQRAPVKPLPRKA